MISIQGVLSIRSINGSRGRFNVGRLMTDLGDFVVKDSVLDQYEEGKYEGIFDIGRIMPSYYTHAGRIVVEMRAVLGTMALFDVDITTSDGEDERLAEFDSIIDELSTTGQINGIVAEIVTEGDVKDEEVFGLLWPLGNQVKLDPTVGREMFRTQRDRLRLLGYCFQPIGQVWVRD